MDDNRYSGERPRRPAPQRRPMQSSHTRPPMRRRPSPEDRMSAARRYDREDEARPVRRYSREDEERPVRRRRPPENQEQNAAVSEGESVQVMNIIVCLGAIFLIAIVLLVMTIMGKREKESPSETSLPHARALMIPRSPARWRP